MSTAFACTTRSTAGANRSCCYTAPSALSTPAAQSGGSVLLPPLTRLYRSFSLKHRGHGRTDNTIGQLSYARTVPHPVPLRQTITAAADVSCGQP